MFRYERNWILGILFHSYRNLNLQFLNINDDEINMNDYKINYLTLILMFLLILMLLNIAIGINIIRNTMIDNWVKLNVKHSHRFSNRLITRRKIKLCLVIRKRRFATIFECKWLDRFTLQEWRAKFNGGFFAICLRWNEFRKVIDEFYSGLWWVCRQD